MGCICFFPNSCGGTLEKRCHRYKSFHCLSTVLRMHTTGTSDTTAAPPPFLLVQNELIVFITSKHNILRFFSSFYFKDQKYVTAKDWKRYPNAVKKKHSVRQNEVNLKSQDKVRELETKIIGQCYFYFKDQKSVTA